MHHNRHIARSTWRQIADAAAATVEAELIAAGGQRFRFAGCPVTRSTRL
jgi:hypothetical protein